MCTAVVTSGPQIAAAFEGKDCEQTESDLVALRACTALLDAGNLDDTTTARYRIRRGYAWLTEEDGAGQAVADFSHALDSDRGNAQALKGRATAYALTGIHAKAIEDWTNYLATNPGVAETEAALIERGQAHFAKGDPEAALADYTKVLQLDPKSTKAYIARGSVYAAQGLKDKVLKEYEAALAATGGSYELSLGRAQIAESWGDLTAAIEHYRAALKTDPRKAWEARRALKRLGVDSPSE